MHAKIFPQVMGVFFLSYSLYAIGAGGYLSQNVTVTKISSTSGNIDAFWLYYTGGSSDNCSGKVKFKASNAGTTGTFERTFSLATTALVTGKKIEIYTYTNTSDCESAVSINILQ